MGAGYREGIRGYSTLRRAHFLWRQREETAAVSTESGGNRMKNRLKKLNFHCLIFTLYYSLSLTCPCVDRSWTASSSPWTVLRFEADFSEGLLLCDASGIPHPACTADTSLINQWDVNMTVHISSSSVLQTRLAERKGNFWRMQSTEARIHLHTLNNSSF